MLGREVRLPVEVMLESGSRPEVNYGEYVSGVRDKMNQAHEVAREHLGRAARRHKDTHDAKKCFHRYGRGDVVWFATNRGQLHMTPKLRKRYEGPYVITQRINDLLYRVQLTAKGGAQILHHDKLKPYKGRATPRWIRTLIRRLK